MEVHCYFKQTMELHCYFKHNIEVHCYFKQIMEVQFYFKQIMEIYFYFKQIVEVHCYFKQIMEVHCYFKQIMEQKSQSTMEHTNRVMMHDTQSGASLEMHVPPAINTFQFLSYVFLKRANNKYYQKLVITINNHTYNTNKLAYFFTSMLCIR